MSEAAANRAVLCDDDDVLRSVVRRMMDDAGYLVVAEAADPEAALEAMESTGADVLLLDLALETGRGEDVITDLATRQRPVRIVVFSAYVSSPQAILDAGATAVVEKPDFLRLERVLRELRTGDVATERRRPVSRTKAVMPPATLSTIDGFEPWRSFCGAVDALGPGDAVLALDVVPDPASRELWDHVFELDHRVALARLAVAGRRAGERLSFSPDGLPVLLVVGGHPEAPTAVFSRLERAWTGNGIPVGAFGHVADRRPPTTVLDDVLAAMVLSVADPAHPLRMV